jgi:hypothetical protein
VLTFGSHVNILCILMIKIIQKWTNDMLG